MASKREPYQNSPLLGALLIVDIIILAFGGLQVGGTSWALLAAALMVGALLYFLPFGDVNARGNSSDSGDGAQSG